MVSKPLDLSLAAEVEPKNSGLSTHAENRCLCSNKLVPPRRNAYRPEDSLRNKMIIR